MARRQEEQTQGVQAFVSSLCLSALCYESNNLQTAGLDQAKHDTAAAIGSQPVVNGNGAVCQFHLVQVPMAILASLDRLQLCRLNCRSPQPSCSHLMVLIVALQAAVVRPQLRESSEHQAVIPDKVGEPPAPSHSPPRWDLGPSYEDALASARGPEKAAADLLPLDATFDPETHEGAGTNRLDCATLCCAIQQCAV